MHRLGFLKRLGIGLFVLTAGLVTRCPAQDTQLTNYLSANKVVLRTEGEGLLSSLAMDLMLVKRMTGKKLLIFGEGGSHALKLNAKIWLLLLRHMAGRNLKYSFAEGARAWAKRDNDFLQSSIPAREHPVYRTSASQAAIKGEERRIYDSIGKFKVAGIDFERPAATYEQVRVLMQDKDAAALAEIYALIPALADSGWKNMSQQKYVRFYAQLGRDLHKNSPRLRQLLGREYEQLNYLLTNPNNSTPADPRDKKMADNLLKEIADDKPEDRYLLDCGMAHSRPNKKGSLANILSASDPLKDRITVISLYCEDCFTNKEEVSNWAFPFMEGEVLRSFQQAAKGDDIVVFDLSNVPAAYSYVKENGELLVFARHQ